MTSESRPGKKVIQDDHFETDPLTIMHRGLVHVAGSERSRGCPSSQMILEIRIQRGGISIQGPTIWAVPGYLDDWLILAQSEAVSTSHKTLLISYLVCLGIRVNFAKSILSRSQRVSFLGAVIDSVQMTATVLVERATMIHRHAASFKEDTARPLKAFQKKLDLMAASSPVL